MSISKIKKSCYDENNVRCKSCGHNETSTCDFCANHFNKYRYKEPIKRSKMKMLVVGSGREDFHRLMKEVFK